MDHLGLPSCQVLQVRLFGFLQIHPHCFTAHCHLSTAVPRFNQLWRQHVHDDKHSPPRRKPTKCEPFLIAVALRVWLQQLWDVKVTASRAVAIALSSSSLCSTQFPMGAGGDGPLGGMAGMEPHHMNGSLGENKYFNDKHCI